MAGWTATLIAGYSENLRQDQQVDPLPRRHSAPPPTPPLAVLRPFLRSVASPTV
jgi:hypothetical protein